MGEQYHFGRFTLDPTDGRLIADGEPVRLGSTDLRLLLALVESAGVLVTKGDLVSRIWGRFKMADSALYVHVSALRKVVGHDCIVNKNGRGYRFVAPVRRSELRAPAKSVGQRTGNLFLPSIGDASGAPSRLIGRSEQLRLIAELLAPGHLVTLRGPGGVGKTRLALQAAIDTASRFADGAWLVELASLNDQDLVPGAVASVLGVKIGDNATAVDAIARHLAQKSLLIVLDNCEHVIGACATLCETLLRAASGLHILATSREALSCDGEQVLEVPPLAVPGEAAMGPDTMRKTAALELFTERAKGADANFHIDDRDVVTAARICRRVDGLPLAIEMAASWASTLGLETLDTKLERSMNAWLRARRTAPARHSTLRATLEWSYGLLSATEQTVLNRLAVFAGSFSMQAAEAVAGDAATPKELAFEHVATLSQKSMIAVVPGSRAQRYRLLETTRPFLLEKLAASEDAQPTRKRHANHALRVLETAMCEWEITSDAVWLERYRPVLDDLRAALDWAMGEESDDAVALAGASWPLWRELSLRAEGRQRLSPALTRLRPDTPPALEARLRRGLGAMLLSAAATKAAQEEIERAVVLYRKLGERPQLGSALTALGWCLLMLGRMEEADRAILEALGLLEHAGWPRTLAVAYSIRTYTATTLGHFDIARAAEENAARLCEIAGADRISLVVPANLVQLSLEKGDIDGAISAGRDVMERLRDTPHSDLRGFVQGVLAAAHTARGDLKDALAVAREAAPLLRDEGAMFWLFDHLALRAVLAGRAKDGALIAGYANGVHEKSERPRELMGRQAMERTATLLRDALTEKEIAELDRLGARLSEDQAITIALSA